MFRAFGFERDILNGVHRVETALALILGDVTAGVPLVRIHSQCFTGEMLGSLRCDCRDQLEMAMQAIAKEGRGLLIYDHQEGRGIGRLLDRRGQTEAAVDLASLAGLSPAGVICEIVNDDGTMARVPDLIRFCQKHRLVMITVSELARYRMDLDDGAVLEALEGFIPVCPRSSAPKSAAV
jgi:hypothetical protein